MKTYKIFATLGVAVVLAGCAQESQISPEPVFDKFGGGSCTDGYIYTPGTANQPDECLPPPPNTTREPDDRQPQRGTIN